MDYNQVSSEAGLAFRRTANPADPPDGRGDVQTGPCRRHGAAAARHTSAKRRNIQASCLTPCGCGGRIGRPACTLDSPGEDDNEMKFRCPHCGKLISIQASPAREVNCTNCAALMTVPKILARPPKCPESCQGSRAPTVRKSRPWLRRLAPVGGLLLAAAVTVLLGVIAALRPGTTQTRGGVATEEAEVKSFEQQPPESVQK